MNGDTGLSLIYPPSQEFFFPGCLFVFCSSSCLYFLLWSLKFLEMGWWKTLRKRGVQHPLPNHWFCTWNETCSLQLVWQTGSHFFFKGSNLRGFWIYSCNWQANVKNKIELDKDLLKIDPHWTCYPTQFRNFQLGRIAALEENFYWDCNRREVFERTILTCSCLNPDLIHNYLLFLKNVKGHCEIKTA